MSVHPAAVNGGGFKQDPFDPADHYYVPQSSTQPPAKVNLRADHAQLASKIYDQGQTSSCTANAAAAAFWYEEKAGRRAAAWGEKGPSRLFIYWLARLGYINVTHDIQGVADTGSNSRDAMKGIAQVGACSEDDWPFSEEPDKVNKKPSDTAFTNADPHKITSYYRLDPDRPDAEDGKLTVDQKNKIGVVLLDSLKKCLTEGFPVTLGFWFYLPGEVMFDTSKEPYTLTDVWNMPNSKFPRNTFPWDLPDELKILDENKNPKYPGHSVLAVGYDDDKGAVLVQNSWGAKWSGNGTFWMPYAWITDFAATNDFWTIRTTHIGATVPKASPTRWEDVHQQILGKGIRIIQGWSPGW